ncbi:MAG: efflux RND transporter periplasmic adaptor subunit [Mucinivorans sp.]
MRYLAMSLTGTLLLCACAGQPNNPAPRADISIDNNTITVKASAPVLEKIKTQTLRAAPFKAQFSTSGVVQAIPTAYAEIASPFAGRIVRSFVRLGQKVDVGSPLFAISSPSFFETGKAYFGAKQEMQQALRNLNRERDLLANHVGVAKDAQEAEVTYQLKKQDFENASSALKVFQVEPTELRLGEPLVVRSPLKGKVVTSNIVIGQYIKEDARPQAVIANLSKVWVVAHVKERDIRLIERLRQVEIRLAASVEDSIVGTIYHISDMLDEQTRSVEVIIECDNSKGRMKPFMYATVTMSDAETDAILIPNSAILQQEENCYVLINNQGHTFTKTPITVAGTIDNQSVVTSGVRAGDRIVSQGAFYLLEAK